ncbi:MAG: hypothetical protein WC648_00310 [Candidatus Paceibacterota bacterium]|jgi:hypothetical protein
MNRERVLNWIGGLWFFINLPIIPFAGSVVNAFAMEYFSDYRIAFATITFIVFLIVLSLSKIWLGKLIKAPVILSAIPFLYATLQLVAVQDYLVQHRPVLFGIIGIVLVVVICTVVIKAMRGELNKKL